MTDDKIHNEVPNKEPMPFKAIKTDVEIFDSMKEQVTTMWDDMVKKLDKNQRYRSSVEYHYMFPKLAKLGIETFSQLQEHYVQVISKESKLSKSERDLVSRVMLEVQGYAIAPTNNQHWVDEQKKIQENIQAEMAKGSDIGETEKSKYAIAEGEPDDQEKPKAVKKPKDPAKPKAPAKPKTPTKNKVSKDGVADSESPKKPKAPRTKKVVAKES